MLSGMTAFDSPSSFDNSGDQTGNTRNTAFNAAVGFSILVHLALLYWLMELEFTTEPQKSDESGDQYMELSLSRSSDSAPEVAEPQPLLAAEDPVQAVIDKALEESETVEEITNVEPEVVAMVTPLDQEENKATQSIEELVNEANFVQPQLSREQLNSSIATVMKQGRQDLIKSYVEGCAQYEKEHGVRGCPDAELQQPAQKERALMAELFNSTVNAAYFKKRELRELKAETEFLSPLMKQAGPLGELASANYARARNRAWELEPPPGSTIAIIGVSLDGISLFSGLMAMDKNREITVLGKKLTIPKRKKKESEAQAGSEKEENQVLR